MALTGRLRMVGVLHSQGPFVLRPRNELGNCPKTPGHLQARTQPGAPPAALRTTPPVHLALPGAAPAHLRVGALPAHQHTCCSQQALAAPVSTLSPSPLRTVEWRSLGQGPTRLRGVGCRTVQSSLQELQGARGGRFWGRPTAPCDRLPSAPPLRKPSASRYPSSSSRPSAW